MLHLFMNSALSPVPAKAAECCKPLRRPICPPSSRCVARHSDPAAGRDPCRAARSCTTLLCSWYSWRLWEPSSAARGRSGLKQADTLYPRRTIPLSSESAASAPLNRRRSAPADEDAARIPRALGSGEERAYSSVFFLLRALILNQIGLPINPKCSRIWLPRKRSNEKCIFTSLSVNSTKVGGATAACVM